MEIMGAPSDIVGADRFPRIFGFVMVKLVLHACVTKGSVPKSDPMGPESRSHVGQTSSVNYHRDPNPDSKCIAKTAF